MLDLLAARLARLRRRMKYLAWLGWIVVTACSSNDTEHGLICACVDSNIDTALPAYCSPLTQSGCSAAEKCAWIWDQLPPLGQTTPVPIGHIGCSSAGTLPLGADCGASMLGGDSCLAGLACHDGHCKKICDPYGAAPGALCDVGEVCSQYANYFAQSGTIIAGVCEPSP